jgi:hypothetical protein
MPAFVKQVYAEVCGIIDGLSGRRLKDDGRHV